MSDNSDSENDISTQLIPDPPSSPAAAGSFLASSGLVVAPVVADVVAADVVSNNVTPPIGPGEGTKKSDNGSIIYNMPFLSFTAKTCLEILPQLKPEQIDFEFNVFKRFSDVNNTSDLCTDKKREIIQNQLYKNLSTEFANVVNNVCSPPNFLPSTQSLFVRDEVNTSWPDAVWPPRAKRAASPA